MSQLAERTIEFIEGYDGLKHDNEGEITESQFGGIYQSIGKIFE